MQKLCAGGDEVCVREQGAARPAADRRGVNHDQSCIARGPRAGRRLRDAGIGFDQLRIIRERIGAAPDPVPSFDRRERFPYAPQYGLVVRVGDNNLRCGVADDISDLLRTQAPVDRHQNCAEACGRSVQLHEFEAVLRKDRDAVAGRDTGPGEALCQPPDAHGIVSVRDPFGAEDECGAVRVNSCVAIDDVG